MNNRLRRSRTISNTKCYNTCNIFDAKDYNFQIFEITSHQHTLSLCIPLPPTLKQGASKLQARKPSSSESKNTHCECVFLPSDVAVQNPKE